MSDSTPYGSHFRRLLPLAAFLSIALFMGCAFIATDYKEANSLQLSSYTCFLETEFIPDGNVPDENSACFVALKSITVQGKGDKGKADQTYKEEESHKHTTPFFDTHICSPMGVSFRLGAFRSVATKDSSLCMRRCVPVGTEALPHGIVDRHSNIEMQSLWGDPVREMETNRSLLAIAAGIKQKVIVDRIVRKFSSHNFTIMLFHYDGIVDEWRDLSWSDSAVHVSAINQTKWWFAKRFLHPDIVSGYSYIFLWDEDLEVENFHPGRYLSIVHDEGLEISQPALDSRLSEVHHPITVRGRRTKVHRRIYKFRGSGRCYENSTAPPCTGWVELMAPVFSKAAWPCVWHMIQNDLIHAWGLDLKLGYCAQGDRTKNVGVVDAEYIVYKGIPSLGGIYKTEAAQPPADAPVDSSDLNKSTPNGGVAVPPGPATYDERSQIRFRSSTELDIFKQRWQKAASEDQCWVDPYP